MEQKKILFLDIGGVILSNGWGRSLRKKIADTFSVDYEEMTDRHNLVFDLFEIGKISFDEYLQRAIFYTKRDYTMQDVKNFAFNAAFAFPDMIDYVKEIKKSLNLKVLGVSNEGRELAQDRIQRFDLHSVIDFFVISSFVGVRKPDSQIYQLALELAQASPKDVFYIDDRQLLIEEAEKLGVRGVCHKNVLETKDAISKVWGASVY